MHNREPRAVNNGSLVTPAPKFRPSLPLQAFLPVLTQSVPCFPSLIWQSPCRLSPHISRDLASRKHTLNIQSHVGVHCQSSERTPATQLTTQIHIRVQLLLYTPESCEERTAGSASNPVLGSGCRKENAHLRISMLGWSKALLDRKNSSHITMSWK